MSLIIKKNTTFKIPRTGSGALILWKIAFFAGAYTNAEYIRQSSESSIFVESSSGDNNYIEQLNPTTFVSFAPAQFGENIPVYYSDDAGVNWVPEGNIEEPDLNPAPLAALSYSPNSVIQSLTLDGSEIATSSGTYDWDGVTTEGGKPKYVKTTAGGVNYIVWADVGYGDAWALFDDEDIGDYTYTSNDLITWTDLPNGAPPSPHVVTLSYSA